MSLIKIRQRLSRSMRDEMTGDDGFTVIEILVAFTLLAVVTIGTVPLFVSGLRSSLVSKLDTGGKNLNQERFERMRTLAFHVDVNSTLVPDPTKCTPPGRIDPRNAANVTECDYRDMLDTYYRSLTPATSTVSGGYVVSGTALCTTTPSASNNCRTSDEPASGSFYRFVLDPVPGYPRYRQTVATQFLTSERAPMTPGSTYNSQIAGYDFPPTRFVGVTVVTTWAAGNLQKKFVAFSQIAEGRPAPAAVTMQARATAIRITSIVPGTTAPQLRLEAGTSSADGALSSGASASTAVESVIAEISGGGGRRAGKAGAAGAPPNFSFTDGGASGDSLEHSGITVARFGQSQIRDVKANIVSEQPHIGDTSDPPNRQSRARIRDVGNNLNLGFNNIPDATPPIPFLLSSDPTSQMPIFARDPGNTTDTTPASAGTWLKSEAGASHRARAGGTASTDYIKILPTSFASQGVVQVKLTNSSLTCTSNGTSSSAESDFAAEVRIWTYDTATGTSGYTTVVNIEEGQLLSPLTPALLATQVGVSGATPILLNQYIQSWASITGPATTSGTTPRSVNRSLNGILSITTQPTRAGDPDSVIGLLIGILSCIAEDNR